MLSSESDLSTDYLVDIPATLRLCACPLKFSVEFWRFCATLKHEVGDTRTPTERQPRVVSVDHFG